MNRKIYLAGPEVFHPNATALGRQKQALCREYGFEGLFPLDSEIAPRPTPTMTAMAVYHSNCRMIESASSVIANLTPFRGPSADPGTVFELGYAAGLGRMTLGYTNEAGTLLDKTRDADPAASRDAARHVWRDRLGLQIEDFGLSEKFDDRLLPRRGRRAAVNQPVHRGSPPHRPRGLPRLPRPGSARLCGLDQPFRLCRRRRVAEHGSAEADKQVVDRWRDRGRPRAPTCDRSFQFDNSIVDRAFLQSFFFRACHFKPCDLFVALQPARPNGGVAVNRNKSMITACFIGVRWMKSSA
jgi:nucleoside 2-deoxyribosyltransferase